MGGITGVHHLNCAHVTRMHLGGKPLACHVMLLEASRGRPSTGRHGPRHGELHPDHSRLDWAFAYGYAQPMIDPSLAAINQVRHYESRSPAS